MPNDLEQIRAALAPYREELAGVVVESTYNGYFLVDGLMDAGYRVHLANTTAIKKYEGLKYSGDFADAAYLAQLLRLGLLPEGYIYPRAERAGRDLGRKRMQLVRCQTMQILAIENILARQTGGRMSGERVKRLTAAQIEELGFAPDVALAVEANRAVSATLQRQIEALEKRLQERVKLRPEYRLLKTVPGIGETLATTIMLETGTITRFASVGNFSSYCRCVDSRRESNGRKKGEGNAKNGNKYLAWAFVEAANFALRYCPEAKRFYERKKRKTSICGNEAPQPSLRSDVHKRRQGSRPLGARHLGRPPAPGRSRPPIRRSRPSRPTGSTNASLGNDGAAHPYATPRGLVPEPPPACPHAATPAPAPTPKRHDKRAEQPAATENPRLTRRTGSSTLSLVRLK